MKLIRFVAVFVFTMLFMASWANAFDGRRSGFILGGGLGLGVASYTQTLEYDGLSETGDRENKGSLITDFRIGWGINEQTEIYYTSKVAWFSFENAFGDKVTIADGIGGIGLSHSLLLAPPTWYLTGGIALASWSLPFEDNAPDAWTGLGLYGGIGYEFSKHYSFEFDVIYGRPGDSEGSLEARTNSLVFKATINALAY
jgi:hypothetical protein